MLNSPDPVNVATGTGRLDISWTAVDGADGYRVQWTPQEQQGATPQQHVLDSGTATRYVIDPIDSNFAYTIRVTAIKDGIDGQPSEAIVGQPVEVTPTLLLANPVNQLRPIPNATLSGAFLLVVSFPGFSGTPIGLNVDDFIISPEQAWKHLEGDIWLIDITDPSTNTGNPVTVTLSPNPPK